MKSAKDESNGEEEEGKAKSRLLDVANFNAIKVDWNKGINVHLVFSHTFAIASKRRKQVAKGTRERIQFEI